jgi:hypothetical protein
MASITFCETIRATTLFWLPYSCVHSACDWAEPHTGAKGCAIIVIHQKCQHRFEWRNFAEYTDEASDTTSLLWGIYSAADWGSDIQQGGTWRATFNAVTGSRPSAGAEEAPFTLGRALR